MTVPRSRHDATEKLPGDDELKPGQLAAMQSLDDARRAGQITEADFAEIEVVIRRGHAHGARKRITEAKRLHGTDRGRPE